MVYVTSGTNTGHIIPPYEETMPFSVVLGNRGPRMVHRGYLKRPARVTTARERPGALNRTIACAFPAPSLTAGRFYGRKRARKRAPT